VQSLHPIYKIINLKAIALLFLFSFELDASRYEEMSIEEKMQVQIEKIVLAKEPKGIFCGLGELLSLSKSKNKKILIEQIFHFALHSDMEYSSFIAMKILTHLQIHKLYVAKAIVPKLSSTDVREQKTAEYLLTYVDTRSHYRKPDFSYYQDILLLNKKSNKKPLKNLKRLMYQIDAQEAKKVILSSHN